ncbi:hypothetical protein [Streptosporangium sp. NPDC049644]|uniref:hypothetical protein n=1 Tax=Streptosporangium sp. NPDC049644 TaxID=3155507 RepID=UPI00344AEC89
MVRAWDWRCPAAHERGWIPVLTGRTVGGGPDLLWQQDVGGGHPAVHPVMVAADQPDRQVPGGDAHRVEMEHGGDGVRGGVQGVAGPSGDDRGAYRAAGAVPIARLYLAGGHEQDLHRGMGVRASAARGAGEGGPSGFQGGRASPPEGGRYGRGGHSAPSCPGWGAAGAVAG